MGEDLPLAGTRVLEIGGGLPAAFATRWLAGFGADVVRSDAAPEGLGRDEQAALLPGKRRVGVGDEKLRELALAAEIVVEDGAPGALAARGLDPRELRREKRALVIVSLTPFGQTGPAAHWRAANLTAHAAGGILSLTGIASRPPLQNGYSQAWMLLGLNGSSAALAAYYGSLAHGEGDWLDISAQECAAGMLEYYGPRAAFDNTPAVRLGNRVNCLWGIFPVADGFAGVCALQRQAPAFLNMTQDPELSDPRLLEPAYRLSNDAQIGDRVARWFRDKKKLDLLAMGESNKVPMGAVMTPLDLLANASLEERGFFDAVQTPAGEARIPGRPYLGMDWRAGELHAPAADTEAVLADWLGAAS
ncbi:MAG TPA: CoA transferase [Myxococcota bacterium]|nr:CoA transferase [Myxococcota bacterium]